MQALGADTVFASIKYMLIGWILYINEFDIE